MKCKLCDKKFLTKNELIVHIGKGNENDSEKVLEGVNSSIYNENLKYSEGSSKILQLDGNISDISSSDTSDTPSIMGDMSYFTNPESTLLSCKHLFQLI